MTRRRTAAVLIALLLAGCERPASELRLARPLASTPDNEIAMDILNLLDRESNVMINFTDDEMSELDALEALIAGDADIALVSNSLPFRRRVATVLPMYPNVLHIGYMPGRNPSDFRALLQGARVFAGEQGSASRLMFESVRSRLHLGNEEFSYVEADRDSEQAGAEFPDVFVVFAPVAADNLEDVPPAVRDNIRFYSLGSPADIGQGGIIDSATLLNPYLEPFVIPAGTYGAITPQPVLTLSVDMMLVARRDLDDAVVYDLVQEVLRLKPALAALRPGLFRRLSDNFDSSNSTFVLHPGLVAYEQRDAPTVYERYSGIAEVVVTLFVAIVSAMFAVTRMYKLRRKNRIDVFYRKTMEIRNSVFNASAAERDSAIAELRALQTSAFEQLIDEKLAADESFRIFIAQSSDLIDELRRQQASS